MENTNKQHPVPHVYVEHQLMARVNSLLDTTYIQPTKQLEPAELEKLRVSFRDQVQVWQPETGVLEERSLRDENNTDFSG